MFWTKGKLSVAGLVLAATVSLIGFFYVKDKHLGTTSRLRASRLGRRWGLPQRMTCSINSPGELSRKSAILSKTV